MAAWQWVSQEEYQQRLTPGLWRAVLIANSAVLLLLAWFLPPLLSGLVITGVVLKWASVSFALPRLAKGALLVLIPAGLLIVGMGFRQQSLTFTFIGFLVAMALGKLLESSNSRDMRILFLLNLCLVMAVLMYSQSFAVFVLLLIALLVNLAVMLKISQRDSRVKILAQWRAVLKLFALALPVAVLLFAFFPRMDPLWGMPRPQNQAITGLPDEMSMDDLTQLVQSNEISFRVRFDGEAPASELLYWRGPVLWNFDGNTWRPWGGDFRRKAEALRYMPDSVVAYQWTAAKPDISWLTTLDMPLSLPEGVRASASYQMQMPLRKKGSDQFQLRSATRYQLAAEELMPQERWMATQLPENLLIPRTQALARTLLMEGGNTPRGFANAFLNHLRSEEFYYSLEPMPGAGDVEAFLFSQRIGFCQHYANAMAIAARAVDIPSRVIIGYQGGEYNPMSEEWVVREENAHAWVELWLPDQGWTRFDPTAAIAPYRIQSGGLSGDLFTGDGEDRRAWGSRMAESFAAVAWLRHALDAGQTFWQNWVINLNRDRQSSLLGQLGISTLGEIAILIGGSIIAITLGILAYGFWRRRKSESLDPLAKACRQLLRKLAKHGVSKPEHESFGRFLWRHGKALPEKDAVLWRQAAALYNAVRYGDLTKQDEAIKAVRKINNNL